MEGRTNVLLKTNVVSVINVSQKCLPRPRIRALKLFLSIITILGMTIYFIDVGNAVQRISQFTALLRPKTKPHFAPPANLDSIFMIETTGKENINPLQACVVESAARANPEMTVTLYFTSREISKHNLQINALRLYENIRIRTLTSTSFYSNSTSMPAQVFKISLKDIKQVEFNDFLRFLLLWEYGGIYLDLDMLVINPLTKLTNCVGREADFSLAVSVMAFEKNHPFLMECLEIFLRTNYSNTSKYNGSAILKEALHDKCSKTSYRYLLSNEICGDIAVLPSFKFYPIPRWRKKLFYDPSQLLKVTKLLSRSFTTHLWKNTRVNKTVKMQPYEIIIQTHCPIICKLNNLV